MKKILIIFTLLVVLALSAYFIYKSNSQSGEKSGANSESIDTSQTYSDSAGLFDISYPSDFKANEIPVDESVRKVSFESGTASKGFELTITLFDEAGPLTQDRIRQDMPDLPMSDVVNLSIDGEDALSFNSADPALGDTHEVWFIRSGHLFQATGYRAFGSQMNTLMKTMKFK